MHAYDCPLAVDILAHEANDDQPSTLRRSCVLDVEVYGALFIRPALQTHNHEVKTMRRHLLFPVALLALSTAACAAIIHGSYQDVPVNTVPSGVTVTVLGRTYTTPATIELKRNDPPLTLHFHKDGYEDVDYTLTKKVDGWIVGNIVFGGIIGLIVDFAAGSAYNIRPETVDVTLPPDEDQFVVWIEIRPNEIVLNLE